MKKTYIYYILDPRPNKLKIYVGKSNNPKNRFKSHINDALVRNIQSKKCNWIRKLYDTGFKLDYNIIVEISIEEWKYWEKFYIKKYRDDGYEMVNVREGGDGITFHNDNTKYKLSQARKGIKTGPMDEKTRKKISIGHMKVGKGNIHKDETKKKISDSLIKACNEGRKRSLRGINIKQDHKDNISKGLTDNPLRLKRVFQYDLRGNFLKEWKSTKEIVKQFGCSESSIRLCCTNRIEKSLGYIWKYIDSK